MTTRYDSATGLSAKGFKALELMGKESAGAIRKVRAKCPKCEGNIADKIVLQDSTTLERIAGVVATQCRNCEHIWNVREAK